MGAFFSVSLICLVPFQLTKPHLMNLKGLKTFSEWCFHLLLLCACWLYFFFFLRCSNTEWVTRQFTGQLIIYPIKIQNWATSEMTLVCDHLRKLLPFMVQTLPPLTQRWRTHQPIEPLLRRHHVFLRVWRGRKHPGWDFKLFPTPADGRQPSHLLTDARRDVAQREDGRVLGSIHPADAQPRRSHPSDHGDVEVAAEKQKYRAGIESAQKESS